MYLKCVMLNLGFYLLSMHKQHEIDHRDKGLSKVLPCQLQEISVK